MLAKQLFSLLLLLLLAHFGSPGYKTGTVLSSHYTPLFLFRMYSSRKISMAKI